MKKRIFAGTLGLMLLAANFMMPFMASANGIGDDFSTTTGATNGGWTTAKQAQQDVNYIIGQFNFLGSGLTQKFLEFFFVYSMCFNAKGMGDNAKIMANPEICYSSQYIGGKVPTWPQRTADGKINVKDLLDGKYVAKHSAFILIISLLFPMGIMAGLLFLQYGDSGASSSSSPSPMGMGMLGGDSSGGSAPAAWSGLMKGRVGGWLWEKIAGSDDAKNTGEENKTQLTSWFYILSFFGFLFFASFMLSQAITGKVLTTFDASYSGLSVVYVIGGIYALSVIAFIGIVMLLAKQSLLKFIRMDLNKTEESSAPKQIAILMAIGGVVIVASYVLFSALVSIAGAVLKVG